MKRLFVVIVVTVLTGLSAVTAQNGSVSKVAIDTQKNLASFKNPRGFVIYLPENYDPSGATKYPVLFWLHGLGKDGDGSLSSLDKIFNDQICKWLKSNDVPFIVFAPQDSNGYFSGSYPSRLTKFVQWVLEEYGHTIDPNQQHLAGLSAGGYGIREFIIENSEYYKAMATLTPMSTNLNNANPYAQRIVDNDQYVWIHHGTNDKSPNAIGAVKNFHNALHDIAPERARMTAYVGMGHSAWNEVYDNSGRDKNQLAGTVDGTAYYNWTPADQTWYEWMLAHAKGGTPPEPVAPTQMSLTNSVVADGTSANTKVGTINSNGSIPKLTKLVSGTGSADNAKFTVKNQNELFLAVNALYTQQSSYSIRVEVSNTKGTIQKAFTINVTEPNYPPKLSVINDKSVNEGSTLQFSVFATDNNGDNLVYSIDNTSKAKGMKINSSTGAFSWQPTETQDGIHNVVVQVTDGKLSDSEEFSITVKEVNQKPVVQPLSDVSLLAGRTLELNVVASDPDDKGSIFYSVDAASVEKGVSIGADGKMNWITDTDDEGGHTISVTVSDGSLFSIAKLNVTVLEKNFVTFINEDALQNKLYPNPVSTTMYIELKAPADRVDLVLYDINGKAVKQQTLPSRGGVSTLDMSGFSPGIYYVEITSNGRSEIHKIVRKQ